MKVLHIIKEVTRGGGTMGMLRQCRDTREFARHRVVSLRTPADPGAAEPFEQMGIPVISGKDRQREVRWSNIVQLEWWNNPEINDLIVNADLPPCRLLLHSRAHFDAPGMCPSVDLLRRVDHCTVTTPSAAKNSAFNRNRLQAGLSRAGCVYSAAEEINLNGGKKAPGREIVFGYLGTVEPVKLHPRFLNIASKVLAKVPEARFLFAGEGTLELYRGAARSLGIAGRVKFVDFVSNVRDFLQGLDVFFYPINKYTYATSEKALQEAMFAGLPCVVFPYGGIRDLASPEFSFVAADEDSFALACIRLARSRSLRERMGRQSRQAIELSPPRRSWRRDLLSTWEMLMKRPRKPRSGLKLDRASLFEYVIDNNNLCPQNLNGQELEDCRLVASFVEDDYKAWLEEQLI